MTQQDRILNALRDGPVCGTMLLDWHMPRYAARIHELRQRGYQIISERCKSEGHVSPQTLYILVSEPE